MIEMTGACEIMSTKHSARVREKLPSKIYLMCMQNKHGEINKIKNFLLFTLRIHIYHVNKREIQILYVE